MIAAYLRERFRLTFFGPLALVLAAAAIGPRPDVQGLALQTLGALFLLAQFRIWDDLADRRKDAVTHPQRVLVRAGGPTPLLGLGMALLTLNVGLASQRDATLVSLSLLALLHVALGAYYLLREGRTLLGDQLLLAKYPAFVCVLAGERLLDAPFTVIAAAAVIYAGASAYEAWHDPVSPLGLLFGGRS
jgi:4-hydroxybenzoate polyprenyltransferase